MFLLLRYVKNSILNNKSLFLLLNFIILLCSFLFIFSEEVTSKIESDYTRPLKLQSEYREFIITKKNNDPYFSPDDISINKNIKDIIPEIKINGIHKSNRVISRINIIAKKYRNKSKKQNYFKNKSLSLNKREILISKRAAHYLKKKNGDSLKVYIDGKKYIFKIKGTISNEQIFGLDKKNEFTIVTSYEYLSRVLNHANEVNLLYVNIKQANKKAIIKKFNSQNKFFRIKNVYNNKIINQEISWLKNGLLLIISIIFILSVFLIYNAFKIIIEERIPELGTFITLGATKKSIKFIFLIESFIYGILGSLLGCIIAYMTLHFIYNNRLIGSSTVMENYIPNPLFYIHGVLIGILISIISCSISLMTLNSRKELDIIKNTKSEKSSNIKLLYFSYFATISISLIIQLYSKNFVISCLSLLLFLINISIFVVIISRLLSKLIKKLNISKEKNLFLLSNDLLRIQELKNCMILIVTVFFGISIISSISFSLARQMKSGYSELNFDYTIQNIPNSFNNHSNTSILLNELKEDPSITVINPITVISSNDNGSSGSKTVIGINGKSFIKYINYYLDLNNNNKKIIKSINHKNQVVISKMFSEIYHKKVGDKINLNINERKESYKITSVIDGKTFYNGNFILIGNDNLKNDFNIHEATNIYFKDKKRQNKIFNKIETLGATWTTKKDELQSSLKTANNLVGMIQIVSLSAIVIAIIGLLSNITLMILKRRSEFFIYSTLGFTTLELKVFLTIEIIMISTLPFISIILFTPVIKWYLIKLMYLVGINLNMFVKIKPLLINYIILIIFAILSNFVILKNKININ